MKLTAALLAAVLLASSVGAQTLESAPAGLQIETTEQTAIRRALEELAGRRAEVAALKETIGAKDEQIKALNNLLVQQAQIVEQWRTAATERAGANTIDAKLEASYKASVSRYAVELANVRIDRDRQAGQKKWWGLAGVVLGVVVTLIATKD